MATQTKIPLTALDSMDFNQILALRFCNIDWNTPLREDFENAIDQVVIECATRGIVLDFKFYIAKEWLSPEDTSAVGIPFYLMHPKLLMAEEEFKNHAEGSDPKEFLQLLRHEVGHCFDHAYGISRKKDFRAIFGSPHKHYAPEFYRPELNSKDYVSHLPDYYAQAHPLEDFAETFAVWLDPTSNWQRRYRHRPVALAKIHFIDKKVRELTFAKARPSAPLMSEVQKSVTTLATHYKRQLKMMAKISAHVTMNR